MKKKNILLVETGHGFGGAVTCLSNLLDFLDSSKYNLSVASSHNDNETKRLIERKCYHFFYLKKYKRPGWINRLLFGLNGKIAIFRKIAVALIVPIEFFLKLPFFYNLIRIVKKNRIEIVHINTGLINNQEAVFASWCFGIPCVVHVRGPEYSSVVSRFIAKYPIRFVAVSKFVENSLKNIGVSQKRIQVIYDGVKVVSSKALSETFGGNPNKFCFEKYNVGLFGCLLPWKGHEVFIEAIEILINKFKFKECKYFIVGDVPQRPKDYRDRLEKMVEDKGLSSNVVFTGHQDNVYSVMDKMDIVVHTSINPEPFGMVIIEAMSLGKVVVATNIGGPLEIIQDNYNGRLVSPSDSNLLAQVVYDLLSNQNKLVDMKKNAAVTVKEKFNLNIFEKEINNLYKEIIA